MIWAALGLTLLAALAFFLWRKRKKPNPRLYMGVSVFTGWASPRPEFGRVTGVQCPVEWPWRDMKVKNRVPAIGEYDERDPLVTLWRESQMVRGKIDFVTYQHDWTFHLGEFVINHCAENHPDDSPIQFAMSCWDVQAAATDDLNRKYWDSTYWDDGRLPVWTKDNISAALVLYGQACAPFFAKNSYLRIDGKPVLFRGYAHSLRFYERFGLTPKDVLDLIAHGCGVRPYFVATSTEPGVYRDLKDWGFDAFTEYCLNAPSWDDAMRTYEDYWKAGIATAKVTGLDYWVPATCGFDARGFKSEIEAAKDGIYMPTPEQFSEHLRDAREVARENHQHTRGRIVTYAWSEYYEGGVLEPMLPAMLHDGDVMLRAHAAAVT